MQDIIQSRKLSEYTTNLAEMQAGLGTNVNGTKIINDSIYAYTKNFSGGASLEVRDLVTDTIVNTIILKGISPSRIVQATMPNGVEYLFVGTEGVDSSGTARIEIFTVDNYTVRKFKEVSLDSQYNYHSFYRDMYNTENEDNVYFMLSDATGHKKILEYTFFNETYRTIDYYSNTPGGIGTPFLESGFSIDRYQNTMILCNTVRLFYYELDSGMYLGSEEIRTILDDYYSPSSRFSSISIANLDGATFYMYVNDSTNIDKMYSIVLHKDEGEFVSLSIFDRNLAFLKAQEKFPYIPYGNRFEAQISNIVSIGVISIITVFVGTYYSPSYVSDIRLTYIVDKYTLEPLGILDDDLYSNRNIVSRDASDDRIIDVSFSKFFIPELGSNRWANKTAKYSYTLLAELLSNCNEQKILYNLNRNELSSQDAVYGAIRQVDGDDVSQSECGRLINPEVVNGDDVCQFINNMVQ